MYVLGHARGERAEQVVGDERPALGWHARLGAQRIERGKRPLPNPRPVDGEKLCDLVVGAPAAQHELEHGPLVRRQTRERPHFRSKRREPNNVQRRVFGDP